MKNSYYNNISDVMTIPEYVAQAGTLTTDADVNTIIRGAGTDFSNIEEGDYIMADAQIRRVNSNHYRYNSSKDNGNGSFGGFQGSQMLTIDRAFDAPLAADAFNLVKSKVYSQIEVVNDGGANGKVNGQILPDGETFRIEPQNNSNNNVGLEPVIIDGTGTNLRVTAQ